MPIRFPRESFCAFINKSYRKYFMNSLKEPVSNFPHTDDPNEDLCKGFQSDHDVNHNRFESKTYKSIANF